MTSTFDLPPGNLGWPFIGHTLTLLKNPNYLRDARLQYGDIFKSHLFGYPSIIVCGAENNRFVLENESKLVKTVLAANFGRLMGLRSVSSLQGDEHRNLKKKLLPLFQVKQFTPYLREIQNIVNQSLSRWQTKKQVKVYEEASYLITDLSTQWLMGRTDSRYWEMLNTWKQGGLATPLNLPWTKLGKALKAKKQLVNEIKEVISSSSSSAFYTKLLQVELTSEEAVDQVLNLLLAGQDTLPSAITSLFWMIGKYPEVRRNIEQEINDKLRNSQFSLETLTSLSYLEAVIQETLGYLPPIGVGFREIIKPFNYQGYYFPKNWKILYQITLTHRSEENFEEANEFKPERFFDKPKMKKGSYLPFGGGIRECLGKELSMIYLKVILITAVQYQWYLVPEQDFTIEIFPTPHPKDKLRIQFN